MPLPGRDWWPKSCPWSLPLLFECVFTANSTPLVALCRFVGLLTFRPSFCWSPGWFDSTVLFIDLISQLPNLFHHDHVSLLVGPWGSGCGCTCRGMLICLYVSLCSCLPCSLPCHRTGEHGGHEWAYKGMGWPAGLQADRLCVWYVLWSFRNTRDTLEDQCWFPDLLGYLSHKTYR